MAFILFTGLIFARSAQAGILSNLAAALFGFSGGEVAAGNSQTVALLESTLAPDPKSAATSSGDTTIVGGSAFLPDSGPVGTIADVPAFPKSDRISVYIVRPGDTLSQIANMFDVSVNTIVWSNNLKRGAALQTGQELTILPISGVSHTVAKGDTLKTIARKYNADATEIASFNDLSSDTTLVVGSTIIVPDGELVVTVSKPSSSGGGTTSSSLPTYSGYFMRPITGGRKSQGLHGYKNSAVDLATYYGAPIFAAADGTVIISKTGGWNGGYGNYIVIQHPNGTQTLYSHISENLVTIGEHVSKGDTIARIGLTGKTTGPHVHFEIRGAKNPF